MHLLVFSCGLRGAKKVSQINTHIGRMGDHVVNLQNHLFCLSLGNSYSSKSVLQRKRIVFTLCKLP
jgi:hypothetical protein